MSEQTRRALRHTLPAPAYTDAGWFREEMDRIFARMWLAVGRAGEIASPGSFIQRTIAEADMLVLRDQADALRAFHNVCRHRGTRLCDRASGRFTGSIQCPYHAWTYALDGRLLAAPQMDEVEGFDRGDYGLVPIPCEEWDGHVFVSLAARAGRLRGQLGELPDRFAPWRMGELRLVRRVQYEVRANWKLIVQNYNECLHCPVIHPLLNRMHHYLGAENVPTTDTYCGGAMGFRDGIETLSIDGRRRRAVLPGLGEREQGLVNYFAIYPNLLLTLHPDYMTTVTLWPEAPDRTRLVGEWHFHQDEIARPGFVCEDAIEFWDRTNREDWAICEQAQRGISSRGYRPGPYAAREAQLWEFDRFILDRVGRDPAAP